MADENPDVSRLVDAICEMGLQLRSIERDSTRRSIEIGKELLRLKDLIGHGKWGEWLDHPAGDAALIRKHVGTASTVKNHMRLARYAETNPMVAVMTLTQAREAAGIYRIKHIEEQRDERLYDVARPPTESKPTDTAIPAPPPGLHDEGQTCDVEVGPLPGDPNEAQEWVRDGDWDFRVEAQLLGQLLQTALTGQKADDKHERDFNPKAIKQKSVVLLEAIPGHGLAVKTMGVGLETFQYIHEGKGDESPLRIKRYFRLATALPRLAALFAKSSGPATFKFSWPDSPSVDQISVEMIRAYHAFAQWVQSSRSLPADFPAHLRYQITRIDAALTTIDPAFWASVPKDAAQGSDDDEDKEE